MRPDAIQVVTTTAEKMDAQTLAQAVLVWPQGLCYTNELFGGTARGHLALSDSNYDWGQGLPELARWHRQHSREPLDVWYCGTDSRIQHWPFHPVEAAQSISLEELQSRHRGRYLAVGTSVLSHSGSPGAKVLRGLVPAARTTTFLIYDFTGQGKDIGICSGTGSRKSDVEHIDPEILHDVQQLNLVVNRRIGNRRRLETIPKRLVV